MLNKLIEFEVTLTQELLKDPDNPGQNLVDVDQLITFLTSGTLGQTMDTKLRDAVRKAGLALTNDAIDALTTYLDVKLEPEYLGDKHVIDTQAVAGCGASNVGVAGSVAISVINCDTWAGFEDIAEDEADDYEITVTGSTSVTASETRKVNTVASASITQDKKANANAAAGSASTADAGDNAGTTQPRARPSRLRILQDREKAEKEQHRLSLTAI